MPSEKSEEAPVPPVCPTCARPLEDEKPANLDGDRYRTDGRGLTWIRLGGMELE